MNPRTMRGGQAFHTRWPLRVAVFLFILAVVLMPLDGFLVEAWTRDSLPGEIRVALNKAEPFGHAYGVLYILITIGLLSRCGRRPLGALLCCSLGAGLAADVVKVFVGRIRPSYLTDNYGSTFTGLLPWWEAESLHNMFDQAMQSFPSAHTATAIGLAMGLSAVFPRGRAWFFVLAGMVAVQRVALGLHYPSDVLAGASIGILWAGFLLSRFRLGDLSSNESTPASEERDEIPAVPMAAPQVAKHQRAA